MNRTYCNICKKEVIKKHDLGYVTIKGWFTGNDNGTSEGETIERHICRSCCKKVFK